MKKVWMGLGLCVLSVCTSCQNANMNDVVKLLTEQAVDNHGVCCAQCGAGSFCRSRN